MKRGFTLIEVMIASAISVIMFTALFVSLVGIFQLMRTSSEELQLAIHARYVRERLLVNVKSGYEGLLGLHAKVGSVNEATGFTVNIARSGERMPGVEQPTDPFRVPQDLLFLNSTKASDVGLTGNVVDKVRDTEFLPTGTGAVAEKLIRLNLYHHPTGSRSNILEDHPVFYMENGAW